MLVMSSHILLGFSLLSDAQTASHLKVIDFVQYFFNGLCVIFMCMYAGVTW